MHHADPGAILTIILAYFIFAALVLRSSLRVGLRTKKGQTRAILSAVFLFCGFTGYGTFLLPDSFDNLSRLSHWILAFTAIALCVRTAMGDMFGDDE